MPKKKKAPPALGNESDDEQEEEEKEEQEPLRVASAIVALQAAIGNMPVDGESDGEEEKEEPEPPRVPSAVVVPVLQHQLLAAHRDLMEAIANLRAISGISSESGEEELGPNRRLSAAMVRRRQTVSRERAMQRALTDVQATHQVWGLARALLLSWQDNDARLARRQDAEAEANRDSEERQLREKLAISA